MNRWQGIYASSLYYAPHGEHNTSPTRTSCSVTDWGQVPKQPFDTSSAFRAVPNVYQWTEFTSNSFNMNLFTQHRISDSSLNALVYHLRLLPATYSILRRLSENRIICESNFQIHKVLDFYQHNSDVVFISVSKTASALLNEAIIS